MLVDYRKLQSRCESFTFVVAIVNGLNTHCNEPFRNNRKVLSQV